MTFRVLLNLLLKRVYINLALDTSRSPLDKYMKKQIKTIPYGRQSLNEADIKAVVKVLKSDWLTQGPAVKEFEEALAKYCGAKYAVAVSNGTAALHLAYLAAGLKPGDEVITTPNTFAATSNMLMAIGAKPVFCDIKLDNYNIDEAKLERLISPRTKAIVPVHFAGHPCNMEKIMDIAQRHGLLVIEDACHALGASYKGKKIGGIGDMSVFSFHPVKSITTGEGGAILTNDQNFYKKLAHLRTHGITKDENGFNVMTDLGYNYRITDIQTALGTSQLKKLNKFVAARQKVFDAYKKELADVKEISTPVLLKGLTPSNHIFVILTKDPSKRNALAEFLKKNGIGVNFHYPMVYAHPYYRANGYGNLALKNSDIYHASCITLPLYADLKKSEVKYISNKIKEFFR
jgi:perosamine synthetase